MLFSFISAPTRKAAMSLIKISDLIFVIFFGKFKGIGIGTVIITVCNGWIIGLFSKLFDKFIEVKPLFPKAEEKFAL